MILGSFQPKVMTNLEFSQNLQKLDFRPKKQFCDSFWPKKISNFEFSYWYHNSYTLEDILGDNFTIFSVKSKTKSGVISQKPSKLGFLVKMAILPFWVLDSEN